MSRKLSKIMMICALVAILPLMIVGVALASYYSIGKTIEVDSYTDYAAQGDAYASVAYKNTTGESFTVSDSHLSTVELTAVSTGYDFQGWFAGSQRDYVRKIGAGEEIEFISENKTLSFGIKEYENVLAVFNIKEFEISYNDPEHGVVTNVNQNTMYGKKLLVPENTNPAYDFKGWKIVGEEEVYTNANFENQDSVNLVAVWKNNAQVNVNFYDGDTLLDTQNGYETKAFELPAVSTLVTPESGYEYAWTDAEGNVIEDLTLAGDTNIYVKKEAIVYNLSISGEDISYNGVGNINFTKENVEDVEKLFVANNWSGAYSFYTLGNIAYDGTNYASANALVSAIVESNPNGADSAVEIEVIANKYFSKFNSGSVVTTNYVYYVENQFVEGWQPDGRVFVGDDWTAHNDTLALSSHSALSNANSSMKVVDILDITDETALYNHNGAAVKIASIKVVANSGRDCTIDVDENTTIEDVIEMFMDMAGNVANAQTFNFESMEINFVLA